MSQSSQNKIVLVEDDHRLASLVQEYMEQQELHVTVVDNGNDAVQTITEVQPDLVILDIMLPGKDGFEICRELRPKINVPIMMLTAKDEDIDQIVGLELGADDYVTKPVQPRLLLARVRALLRRNTNVIEEEDNLINEEVSFGKLRVNKSSQEVWLDEQPVEFTTNEFKLLWLLVTHAGDVLSRDDILASLRGIGYDGLDRSVDVRVSRLRKKLGDDSTRPFRIKTIWGKGYLFVRDAWD